MRIRSITLHGFKSFGNRTGLEFSESVTVVAGPNGSGKSNVVDALRWATGGGRASEFRAGEKTELIFHGASSKRSLGYAEVEVELETPGGTVTVRRTLQRDGTGTLRLNGRNARFLDIDEALTGSGLGRGSLAIIGQGEVSSVLMADPARLLGYVNDAAGVARLAGRREQARARLDAALGHLDRLEDLHGELSRQVERLEQEAAAALSHSALTREELHLRHGLARTRADTLAREIRELAEQEEQLAQHVAAGQERLAALRREHDSRRQVLEEEQERYRRATAAVETWRGEQRLAASRLETARQRGTDMKAQHEHTEREIARLAALVPPEAPEGDEEALREAATRGLAALERARANEAAARAALTGAGEALARLESEARDAQLARAGHDERSAALEAQLAEARAQLAGEDGHEDPAAAAQAHAEQLVAAADAAAARLTAARSELEAVQLAHASAAAEAQARGGAAARLQAAVAARRGFAQGPRSALEAGIAGVIGPVADLLSVPSDLRAAVGASLGRRSEYIVVDTAETGHAAIAHVREQGGFVTVMPLDLLPSAAAREPRLAGRPGVIGPLIDRVGFDPDHADLFAQLFGDTLLVEDMTSAISLARGARERPRLVTLAGEVLDAHGAMSGGRSGAVTSVIGLARDLEEAETSAAAAAEDAETARTRLLAVQDSVREVQAATAAARDAAAAAQAELATRLQTRAGAERLRQELAARVERLASQLAEVRAAEPPAPPDEAALERARAGVRTAAAEAEHGRTALEAARHAAAAGSEALAVFAERRHAHRRAQERYEADREQLARLLELRDRNASAGAALAAEAEAAAAELEALAAREPAPLDEIREKVDGERRTLAAAERALDEANRELAQHAEAIERTRLAAARREAMLTVSTEELERFPPGLGELAQSERSARTRLAEVTAAIEELGPVNHRAAAELEETRLRAHQLAADLLDARQATEELDDSLARVDAEATRRSEAAVAAIREKFRTHVGELFGGDSEADIEVERADGRPEGLVIRLRPPGKRTTQLNLLSVGERTMGALAFLFALMDGADGGGLPLAVLDEVDAPLDEANITRFTAFVERLAQRGTQFVLISHQKTTFSVADAMWGVTSDGGVSSVFSISRGEPAQAVTSAGGT